MRKLLVCMAVAAFVATSCEVESVQPEPELLLPPAEGVERVVGDPTTTTTSAPNGTRILAPLPQVPGSGPAASAPAGANPSPGSGSGDDAGAAADDSAGGASAAIGQLVWSDVRNGEALGVLSGATLTGAFEVRLESVATEVDRVEWYIDGVLFRDDDLDAPYNLRYFGTLPIDTTFGSDQGLAGAWVLEPGATHTIRAVVISGGTATPIEASFTIAADGTVVPTPTTAPPTTTAAPAPTTTAPSPTTTVPPTTTAPPTTTPPTPHDGSWPGPSNTGVVNESVLVDSGAVRVETDGAVIENLRITGGIVVVADNVTIRNVFIDATSIYGIKVTQGYTGTVIEDVTIVGQYLEDQCDIGIALGAFTARRLDISGCGDGIRAGSNTLFEDSWVHHMRDDHDDHSDSVQSLGGSNIVIRGNNFEMDPGMTSAIILHGNHGPLSDVLVENNRIAGGGYTLNIKVRKHPVTDVIVRNNVWVRDSYNFGPITGDSLPTGDNWTGNRFEDGEPIER